MDVPFFQTCASQYALVFTKVQNTIFAAFYRQEEPSLVSGFFHEVIDKFLFLDFCDGRLRLVEAFVRSYPGGLEPEPANAA